MFERKPKYHSYLSKFNSDRCQMSNQGGSVNHLDANVPLHRWMRPRRSTIRLVDWLHEIATTLGNRLVDQFHDNDAAAIFVRLIQSKHVADLRLIAFVALLFALISTIVTPFACLKLGADWKQMTTGWWVLPQIAGFLLGATAVAIPAIGGSWAIAVAVQVWCYQSGSARLGTVDLFASEITTLCRVCAIVELTRNCVDAYKDPSSATRARFSHFDSEESYTPVSDGDVNDLRPLDMGVITNVTSFYTYWKAMRDAFRQLASTPADVKAEVWQRAMCNVVYMQFLAFESARMAIDDLIESSPIHAENKITILLSELPAFGFLLDKFPPDDVRCKRLELRRRKYEAIVDAVQKQTETNAILYPCDQRGNLSPREQNLAAVWDKAAEMLSPLTKRYEEAFQK